MVDIATVTVFWNSLKGLKNLLPTISGRFKGHVFIDGVYKEWPLTEEQRRGNGLSTDGSRELIQRHVFDKPSRYKLLDAPYKTEYEKRSMYLDAQLLIRDLGVDAILIIDTDEYISEFDFDYFYGQCELRIMNTHRGKWNVYGVMIQDQATEARQFESFQPYPHLWYKPWDMIYKPHSHYQYINCRWELERHLFDNYCQVMIETIEGIKIIHDPTLRSKLYLEGKDEYQSWLRKHEQDMANKKYHA